MVVESEPSRFHALRTGIMVISAFVLAMSVLALDGVRSTVGHAIYGLSISSRGMTFVYLIRDPQGKLIATNEPPADDQDCTIFVFYPNTRSGFLGVDQEVTDPTIHSRNDCLAGFTPEEFVVARDLMIEQMRRSNEPDWFIEQVRAGAPPTIKMRWQGVMHNGFIVTSALGLFGGWIARRKQLSNAKQPKQPQ